MSFQIKDFSSIAASILNYAKAVQSRITDFSVGSVARTILEAPAVEIEELYQQMWIGLKESIPVAVYNSFDFARYPAKSSTGTVRVSVTPPSVSLIIPAGTTFSPSGYSTQFRSIVDAEIAPGNSFADIYVYAVTPGAAGNVISGTSFSLSQMPDGFVSATALSSFTSGADLETDEQRKSRFISFVQTMNRGTVAAIRYGLSLVMVSDSYGVVVERVLHKKVIEPYKADPMQPVGLVECYIHNGENGASSALVNRAIDVIHGYVDDDGVPVPGWKAAGIKVNIHAAQSVSVNIQAQFVVASGYIAPSVAAEVSSVISEYLSSLDIGESVVVAEIIAAAMGVPGVVNVFLLSPVSDMAISNTEKAIPGIISITEGAGVIG